MIVISKIVGPAALDGHPAMRKRRYARGHHVALAPTLRWSAGRRRPLRHWGRNASQAFPGGPIARLAHMGVSQTPGASRRSIPSRCEGRKQGKDAPASLTTGPAEHWLKITATDATPGY